MVQIKEIAVESLRAAVVVANDVLDQSGRVLLAAGRLLTPEMLAALQRHGVGKVSVQVPGVQNQRVQQVPPLIPQTACVQLMHQVREVFQKVAAGQRGLDAAALEQVSLEVAEQLSQRRHLLLSLQDLSYVTDYLYAHSVHVGIIAIALGLTLDMSQEELVLLGLGGFLHDLGKVQVPGQILNKQGKLSSEEFALVQEHAAAGYKLLRQEPGLDTRVLLIALQHHERYDGSGYPWSIAGDSIHRLASVVAVADVYDALTTDRVYRGRLPVADAVGMIGGEEGRLFDPEVVQALKRIAMPYAPGDAVELSDGRQGVVAMLNSADWSLPIVRLPGELVDLLEAPQVRIVATAGG